MVKLTAAHGRESPGKFDVSDACQNPGTAAAFSNRYSRSTLQSQQCLPEWLLSPRGELPLRQAHHENSARASQYQLANAVGSDFPVARQFCHSTFCLRLQTTAVSDLRRNSNRISIRPHFHFCLNVRSVMETRRPVEPDWSTTWFRSTNLR